MEFIDLKAQYQHIENEIRARIKTVLDHGQYIMGPEVKELELKLAEFTGANYAITCASGTDALVLALRALNIGVGDEVITSAFSFFATAEAICHVGATPVFVDIDNQAYNIDPSKIESEITNHTKAIIPVGLFGQCANLSAINEIAARYELAVIEDAAQCFGATHNQLKSCSITTIACTSFFPAKPLGCYGDGGACFTNDEQLAEKLSSLRVHGKGQDKYDNIRIGMNSRLDTIQAAILLQKLSIFPDEIKQRNIIAKRYSEALEKYFVTPSVNPENSSVWAQYCLRSADRERIIQELKTYKIPTTVYYGKALHQQEALAFLGYKQGDFPVAEQVADEIFSIPMHPYLDKSEVAKVINALTSYKSP